MDLLVDLEWPLAFSADRAGEGQQSGISLSLLTLVTQARLRASRGWTDVMATTATCHLSPAFEDGGVS